MSNTALKKELENVVAAWPAMPFFDLSTIANDNDHQAILTFKQQTKVAGQDMALWRQQVLELTDTVERLLNNAEHDDVRTVMTIIAPLQASIEAARQKLTLLLDSTSEHYFWRNALMLLGNIPQNDRMGEVEQHGRETLLGWLDMCQECKDRLLRVIWEHDPDARGGPKFDKADDLIAFLEN